MDKKDIHLINEAYEHVNEDLTAMTIGLGGAAAIVGGWLGIKVLKGLAGVASGAREIFADLLQAGLEKLEAKYVLSILERMSKDPEWNDLVNTLNSVPYDPRMKSAEKKRRSEAVKAVKQYMETNLSEKEKDYFQDIYAQLKVSQY